MANFSSYSKTYGSIATIIVLMLYFFITSAILLFGAEVNVETYRRVAEDPEGDSDQKSDGSTA